MMMGEYSPPEGGREQIPAYVMVVSYFPRSYATNSNIATAILETVLPKKASNDI